MIAAIIRHTVIHVRTCTVATYYNSFTLYCITEMDAFKMEKEREITALMDSYRSSLSEHESSINQQYSKTIGQLTTDLASKIKELSQLRGELDSIRSTLYDKDGNLKSAVSSNEKLREELMITRKQGNDAKKQKDSLEINVTQLQVTAR